MDTDSTLGTKAAQSRIFYDGAEEIRKLGRIKRDLVNLDKIFTSLGAVHRALGKSTRDFETLDDVPYSLLEKAFVDVTQVRVRNRAHLFDELKRRIPSQGTVLRTNPKELTFTHDLLKRIAKRLTKDPAAAWI